MPSLANSNCAAPGAPAKQCFVVPQVAHGLAQHVHGKGECDVLQQLEPVAFITPQGFVQVKRGAAVFGLFGAVPHPQGLQARLCALQGF